MTLLFSGGLDSLLLWYMMNRPDAVYVKIGHSYQEAELSAISELSGRVPGLEVRIVDGPPVGGLADVSGHIPHRNLLLIATVVATLQTTRVALGGLRGELSRDKSPRFTRDLSRALTTSEGERVSVWCPASHLTKTGLLSEVLRNHPGVRDHLEYTHSCYRSQQRGCDSCQACFRRAVAEYHCGIRRERPVRPPVTVTATQILKSLSPSRIPGMIINNIEAGLALSGYRKGIHP